MILTDRKQEWSYVIYKPRHSRKNTPTYDICQEAIEWSIQKAQPETELDTIFLRDPNWKPLSFFAEEPPRDEEAQKVIGRIYRQFVPFGQHDTLGNTEKRTHTCLCCGFISFDEERSDSCDICSWEYARSQNDPLGPQNFDFLYSAQNKILDIYPLDVSRISFLIQPLV